jgi:hypothetical protein
MFRVLSQIKARLDAMDTGGSAGLTPVLDRLDALEAAVRGLSAASGGLPVGMIQAFLPTAIPAGYFPADGRALVKADYPLLDAMLAGAYDYMVDEAAARSQAVSIVPAMTSNTAPSGTASASSIYSTTNYDAWYAFDGLITQPQGWLTSAATGWLRYDLPSGVRKHLTAYTIKPRNNGGALSCVKAWTLEGSNDNGATWAVLDTRSGYATWPADGLTFELDAAMLTEAWASFRVNATLKSGEYLAIGELTMMGLDTLPAVPRPAGSFGLPNLASSPTPIQGGVWCIKAA